LARRFSDVVPLKRCGKGQIELARERLKGHLTTFTINNVVRELVGELNLRSVEAFLRFSRAV
jgi:hypothetical protein